MSATINDQLYKPLKPTDFSIVLINSKGFVHKPTPGDRYRSSRQIQFPRLGGLLSRNSDTAVGSWLDESLLQAIEHVFQMRVPRHAFKGDFVVPRPLMLISSFILIGFVRPHVMQERD
jgi:hypothetical protein